MFVVPTNLTLLFRFCVLTLDFTFLKYTFIDFLLTKIQPEMKSLLLNGVFKNNSLKQLTFRCVDVCFNGVLTLRGRWDGEWNNGFLFYFIRIFSGVGVVGEGLTWEDRGTESEELIVIHDMSQTFEMSCFLIDNLSVAPPPPAPSSFRAVTLIENLIQIECTIYSMLSGMCCPYT